MGLAHGKAPSFIHNDVIDTNIFQVVIFQILMPIVILSQVFFIPESPRWYIQKSKNYDSAKASLMRVRDTEQEVDDELLTIREAIEFESEAISSGYAAL